MTLQNGNEHNGNGHNGNGTSNGYKYVGTRPVRPDGVDKVTGRANFGADISLNGMIYGSVVRLSLIHI